MKRGKFTLSVTLFAFNAVLFSALEANAQARLSINSPEPVIEGNGLESTDIEFTINLTPPTALNQSFSVPVEFNHGTTSDADFFGGTQPMNQSVTFSGTDTAKSITVKVNQDYDNELTETFTLTIGTPTGDAANMDLVRLSSMGSDLVGTGTIRNDDKARLISNSPYRVYEGTGSGSTPVEITISLTPAIPLGKSFSLSMTFLYLSTEESDYTNDWIDWSPVPDKNDVLKRQLDFSGTDTVKTITFMVKRDLVPDGTERFRIEYDDVTGDAVENGLLVGGEYVNRSTVYILDSDSAYLSINSPGAVFEGTGSGSTEIEYTINLEPAIPLGESFSVSVELIPIGIDAEDLVMVDKSEWSPIPGYPNFLKKQIHFSGTDTFKKFSVMVNRDNTPEPDEIIHVFFKHPTGDAADMKLVGRSQNNYEERVTILDDDGAKLSIDNPVVSEGTDSGSTEIEFTINLTPARPLGKSFSVPVTFQHLSTTDSDFMGGIQSWSGNREIEFSGTNTARKIKFTALRDRFPEPDERFYLEMSAPTGDAAEMNLVHLSRNKRGYATILDDDGPARLRIDSPAAVFEESLTGIEFTISLTSGTPVGQPFSVPITFSHGTTVDADFVNGTKPTIAPVSFSGSDTSKTVTVMIGRDITAERDKTFTLTLGTPTGTAADMNLVFLSLNRVGTGTILDDDRPTLSIDSPTGVTEGTGPGSTEIEFSISLTPARPLGQTFSVPVTFNHVTTENEDFVGGKPENESVNFSGTDTVQKITVRVNRDSDSEPDETFTLTIGAPTGVAAHLVQLSPTTVGTGTIWEDDGPARLRIDSPAVPEGDGSGSTEIIFTISLTPATPVGEPFSVPVAFRHGNTFNGDFFGGTEPTNTQVSFSGTDTSKAVSVSVNRNDHNEQDKFFTLTLGALTGTAADMNLVQLSSTTVGKGTIINDDQSQLNIDSPAAVPEGDGTGSTRIDFTISLTPASALNLAFSVDVTFTHITTVDADFVNGIQPANQAVMFSGTDTTKRVSIWVNRDRTPEPNKTFTLTIEALTGVAADMNLVQLSPTTVGTGTILDDDGAKLSIDSPAPVFEGTGSGSTEIEFTISLTPATALNHAFSVAVTFTHGISENADFVNSTEPVIEPVSFSGTDTFKKVSVWVNRDVVAELDKTFTLTIGAPTGVAADMNLVHLSSTTVGTGTILDDDGAKLSIDSPAPVSEGTGFGSTEIEFTISLTPATALNQPFSVAVTFTHETTENADFVTGTEPAIEPASFSGTDTVKKVSVLINRDNEYEPDETFTLTIEAPTGVAADMNLVQLSSDVVGTGTIRNDESVPTISLSAPQTTVAEGGTFTLTLTPTPAIGSGVSIDIKTLTVSDLPGSVEFGNSDANKYVMTSTSDNEITVRVSTNNFYQGTKGRLTVSIGDPGDSTYMPGTSASVSVIEDETVPTINLSAPQTPVAEGGTFTLILTPTPAIGGNHAIDIKTLFDSGLPGTIEFGTSDANKYVMTGSSDNEISVAVDVNNFYQGANGRLVVSIGDPGDSTYMPGTSISVPVIEDESIPTISMSISSASVNEGESVDLTLTALPPYGGGYSVDIDTLNNTGFASTLSGGKSDDPEVMDGETLKITVTATDNMDVDSGETITISFAEKSGHYMVESQNALEISVNDNDLIQKVRLTFVEPERTSVTEGMTFGIKLEAMPALTGQNRINVTSLAYDGNGFAATFSAGDSDNNPLELSGTGDCSPDPTCNSRTVTVTATDNGNYSNGGTLTVNLQGGTDYAAESSYTSVEIAVVDDEPVPTINLSATIPQSAVAVDEGGTFTLTLTPTPAIGGSHTIDIRTLAVSGVTGSLSSGTSDADKYQMTGTSENTITVAVPDNTYYQGANGRLTVSIGDPGDSTYIPGSSASVSVNENESKPVVSLSAPSFPNVAAACPPDRSCVDEGSSFNIALTADPKPGGGFVLPVNMLEVSSIGHGGTISPNPPMINESGSVTIAVTATRDNVFSGGGTLMLELSNGDDYIADSTANTATVEVIEGDPAPVISFKGDQFHDGKRNCSISNTNASLLNCTVSENEETMAVILSMTPIAMQVSVSGEAKIPTAMDMTRLSITDSPATGDDFMAANGEKTIDALTTELVFPITIADNEVDGGDRVFLVEFSQPTIPARLQAEVGFIGNANKLTAIVTIEEDDGDRLPWVSVSVDDKKINEGETAVFKFSSNSNSDLNDISYSIAIEGEYVFHHSRKRVNIPARETGMLSVNTVRDSLKGNNGRLILTVHDGKNYVAREQFQTAEVTIRNIDSKDAAQRYSVAGLVMVSLLTPDTQDTAPPHNQGSLSMPEISIVALEPRVNEGSPARFQVETSLAVGHRLTINLRIQRTAVVKGGDSSVSVAMKPGSRTAPLEVATHNDEFAGSDGRLTAIVMDGEGYSVGSKGSASVVVSDEPDRLTGLGHAVLPEIAASIGSKTLDVTGNRIAQAFSEGVQTGLELAGSTSITDILETGGLMINQGEINWINLLGDSSFSIGLFPEGGETSSATVWGLGSEYELSGNGNGQVRTWSGDVLTGHLGMDAKVGQGMLAGLAVSAMQAEVEFGGKGETDTLLGLQTTGLHPYIGLETGDGGTQVRMTAGYGMSEMDIDSNSHSTNLMNGDFRTFGVKGNSRLHASDGFPLGGRNSLNLIGESWLTEQNLNAVSGSSNPLHTVASHMRMVIEGTHIRTLATGHSVSPSVSIGIRRDGRNGISALGYEIGSDFRYEAPHGFSIDASGMAVMTGLNRLHEWTTLGSIDYDAGNDDLGVLASIQPAWGEARTEQSSFLWGSDPLDVSHRSGVQSNGASLELEVGYGFTLSDGTWTLNPYGGISSDEGQSNEIRIGNRFRTSNGANFEIEGSEATGFRGTVPNSIKLTGGIRW